MAGAGIAVGPMLGGWVTTYLSWRLVFAGEVVVVLASCSAMRWCPTTAAGAGAELDGVGAVLSAPGLALVVLGVLQASTWGWVQPRNPPFEPFGFSLTLFVIAAGVGVLAALRALAAAARGAAARAARPPALLSIPPLRAGLRDVPASRTSS